MFKNWKAICQIPDTHFMWALALLDLATDFGRQVVERLPEYFTQEEQAGPIPLSILRQEASKHAKTEGWLRDYRDDLVCDKACEEYNIPTKAFAGPDDDQDCKRDVLPAELAHFKDVQGIGHIAEWGGKRVVVVENGLPQYICVAPAELIAIDR